MATITNLSDVDSIGYAGDDGNGTIAYNGDWGVMNSLAAGSRYFVYNRGSLKPSIRTDGKVGLTFTAGICGGWGVWDYFNRGDEGSNTQWNVEFDTVTKDTWFLTCVHRKWGAYSVDGNQKTTVQVIDAGPTGAIPAIGSGTPARQAVDFFNVVDWDADDQPLALARVSVDGNGNNSVTSLRDLRAVGAGGGVQVIYDRLAMQYLGYQGTMYLLWENERWVHLTPVADPSGAFSWIEDPGPYGGVNLKWRRTGRGRNGWSAVHADNSNGIEYLRDGNMCTLSVGMRNVNGNITFNSVGNLSPDKLIGNITDAAAIPDRGIFFSGTIITTGGAQADCKLSLSTSGELELQAGPPGGTVRKSDTDFALWATITYGTGKAS